MPNKFFFIVGLCMLVYFAPVKAIQSEAALKEFQSWFETLGGKLSLSTAYDCMC